MTRIADLKGIIPEKDRRRLAAEIHWYLYWESYQRYPRQHFWEGLSSSHLEVAHFRLLRKALKGERRKEDVHGNCSN